MMRYASAGLVWAGQWNGPRGFGLRVAECNEGQSSCQGTTKISPQVISYPNGVIFRNHERIVRSLLSEETCFGKHPQGARRHSPRAFRAAHHVGNTRICRLIVARLFVEAAARRRSLPPAGTAQRNR